MTLNVYVYVCWITYSLLQADSPGLNPLKNSDCIAHFINEGFANTETLSWNVPQTRSWNGLIPNWYHTRRAKAVHCINHICTFWCFPEKSFAFKTQMTGATVNSAASQFLILLVWIYSLYTILYAASSFILFLSLLQWARMLSGLKSHSTQTPIQNAKGNNT